MNMKTIFAISNEISGARIRELRNALRLSQKELAAFAGVSVKTVERWEGSAQQIRGPIAPLIHLLKEDPSLCSRYRIPPKKMPLRLWYMYRDDICTIIDVDERKRAVEIHNYTDQHLFRAFGNIEKPDYAAFSDFLESRCFPRQRDKMKMILNDLDIPFYDPLLIIEKTEGRMAEDDFWIRIER